MCRTVVFAVATCLLALAGCKKKDAAVPKGEPGGARAAAAETLPFLTDDYAGALAKAKADGKPLFVDAWAPWCHTCLSMKHFVLTDKALAPLADRLVWLALDTEKPGAAPFLARYPVESWPTFFIIDSETEQVVGRWLGAGNAAQMVEYVEASLAGRPASRAPGGDGGAPADANGHMVAAMQAATAKDYLGAAVLFRSAITAAPRGWKRGPEALLSLIQVLYKAHNNEDCVELALSSGEQTGRSSITADFASYALECANGLPDTDARKERVRKESAGRLARLTADQSTPLTPDDRGDAFAILASAREALGDKQGTRFAHEARVQLLSLAAGQAPNAEAASTYDGALAESYLALEQGERAVERLQKSEAALPGDYNPPHRLANVLHKLGRNAEARDAIERALVKAYGPRKLGLLKVKAQIQAALGDHPGAIATQRAEVAGYEALPEGQQRPTALEAAKKRLDEALAKQALAGGTKKTPQPK